MAIIQSAIALVALTILYRRMIRRETPEPIGKIQAVLPVILGGISTPLSLIFYLGISFGFLKAGFDGRGLPLVVRSLLSALLQAGIPEEVAKHLGLAAYEKARGGAAGGEYAKAFLLPVTIHILYDAFTADNRMMESENDVISLIGVILAFAVIIGLFVIQVKVLRNFRKDAEKYCEMTLM